MCGYERVGILDWDAHHGDGTEVCVEKGGDTNIRFCSIHAFGKGVFPGTGARKRTEQVLNVPVSVNTDAATYLDAFRSLVLPFLAGVDALIVSAGYDGHEKDPMGLLRLQESTYVEMASDLKEMGCPLLFLLEGGYRPDVLAACVEATLKPWLVLA
jgi:acetoin utilization deacetylase AcuC-like enzyme